MIRKHVYIFFTSDPGDLDLKPSEAKIIRGHGITKTNQHVEYNSSVINISQDNECKLGLGRYSLYRYSINTDTNRYVSIRPSCCTDLDEGDSCKNNDYSGPNTNRFILDFHTI